MWVSPSPLGSAQGALTVLLPSWGPDSHRSCRDSCSPSSLVVVCLPPLSDGTGKGKGGISANSSYSQSLGWDLVWLRSFHWEILGKHCNCFNSPCNAQLVAASHSCHHIPSPGVAQGLRPQQPMGLRAPLDLLQLSEQSRSD